ncbi:MAG: acyl-CoA dehydrogenase, partial [Bacteroidia bacterium]
MYSMDIGVSERVSPILEMVKKFVKDEIEPLDEEFLCEVAVGDRWQHTARQTEILEGLKTKARDLGLWNFFLTEDEGGA